MNSKSGRPIEGEDWLRKWTFSEEERLSLTTAEWNGEARWFSSPNIVPMERYREPEQVAHTLRILRERQRDHQARAIAHLGPPNANFPLKNFNV